MKIILVALLAMLLVVPAQARGQKHSGAQQPQNSEAQKKAREQEDKDYKSALSRIPDQKPADPWGKLR